MGEERLGGRATKARRGQIAAIGTAIMLVVLAPEVGAETLGPTPTPTPAPPPKLSFRLVSVDPARPAVGEAVRVTFRVELTQGRGGRPVYTLFAPGFEPEISSPLPHPPNFPNDVTFEVRAAAGGRSEIHLAATFESTFQREDGGPVHHRTSQSSPAFALVVAAPLDCAGDCNGDGSVRIDELTRAVAVAMEEIASASCPVLPAVVTVDVLVDAVRAALHGCAGSSAPTSTPTSTPEITPTPLRPRVDTPTPTHTVAVTEAGVDLVPLHVSLARCLAAECLTVPDDSGRVCIANQGDADAGEFLVDVNGESQVLLDGLPSGAVACFDVHIGGSATVIVDADDRVAESREDNNEQSFPAPGPTSCDVVVPTCTPTQPVENVQRCEQCCADCATEVCFLTCFGVQGCELRTAWEGTVTDLTTDEPIAGAAVTVNGTAVTTDASGRYATVSVKAETCNALDYLYEVSVSAPGYQGFVSRAYQSLVGGVRVQDVALIPAR